MDEFALIELDQPLQLWGCLMGPLYTGQLSILVAFSIIRVVLYRKFK